MEIKKTLIASIIIGFATTAIISSALHEKNMERKLDKFEQDVKGVNPALHIPDTNVGGEHE